MFNITIRSKHNRVYTVSAKEQDTYDQYAKDYVTHLLKIKLQDTWISVVDDDEKDVIVPISEILYVRVDEVEV